MVTPQACPAASSGALWIASAMISSACLPPSASVVAAGEGQAVNERGFGLLTGGHGVGAVVIVAILYPAVAGGEGGDGCRAADVLAVVIDPVGHQLHPEVGVNVTGVGDVDVLLVVPSKSSVTVQDTWAGVNRLGTGSVWVMRYASVAPGEGQRQQNQRQKQRTRASGAKDIFCVPQTVPPFSVSDPEDIGDNITEAVEPAVILQGVGAGDAAAIVAGGEGAAVRLIGVVGGVIAPAPAGVLRNGVFAHRKLIEGDTLLPSTVTWV